MPIHVSLLQGGGRPVPAEPVPWQWARVEAHCGMPRPLTVEMHGVIMGILHMRSRTSKVGTTPDFARPGWPFGLPGHA